MKEKNEYSYPLSIWLLDIVNGQRGFFIDRTTTLQISKNGKWNLRIIGYDTVPG